MIITDEKLLRLPCEDTKLDDVGPIIDQLDRELIESAKKGYPGVGLAAPQINVQKKTCVIRVDEHSINLVNAKIKKGFDKALFDGEGCLSFPDRYEKTMRYQEIHVVDNLVEPYSFIATGLLAVVIQHEIGHWNNILLPDVALPELNQTIKRKIRPNDKCYCGSGIKFKKCCQKKN